MRIVPQGQIVADSLKDYLRRHPEIECRCSKSATTSFLTTEATDKFNPLASLFMGAPVHSTKITL